MTAGNIAIIGGTGFEVLPSDIYAEPIEVTTRYGGVRVLSVSDNYTEPQKLYFLSRHGADHGLAPHEIDYRANIAALVALGVRAVLATNAVGSLRKVLLPGTLVLLDDFIDQTRGRERTYFRSPEAWSHTDFSIPYSPCLRQAVITAAAELGIQVTNGGTYVGCDGPRFETPAEIRMFARLGGDVVGMTGLPEAVMAREAGLHYAALAIITNLGAGLTEAPIRHEEVVDEMERTIGSVRELMLRAAAHYVQHNSQSAI